MQGVLQSRQGIKILKLHCVSSQRSSLQTLAKTDLFGNVTVLKKTVVLWHQAHREVNHRSHNSLFCVNSSTLFIQIHHRCITFHYRYNFICYYNFVGHLLADFQFLYVNLLHYTFWRINLWRKVDDEFDYSAWDTLDPQSCVSHLAHEL